MKELNLKSEITTEQMLEVKEHITNGTIKTVLTPVLQNILDTIVAHNKNGEFVQIVDDELAELFCTGNYNFVEMVAVMWKITDNRIIINYEKYPWMKGCIKILAPAVKQARRLIDEQKDNETK